MNNNFFSYPQTERLLVMHDIISGPLRIDSWIDPLNFPTGKSDMEAFIKDMDLECLDHTIKMLNDERVKSISPDDIAVIDDCLMTLIKSARTRVKIALNSFYEPYNPETKYAKLWQYSFSLRVGFVIYDKGTGIGEVLPAPGEDICTAMKIASAEIKEELGVTPCYLRSAPVIRNRILPIPDNWIESRQVLTLE